MSDDHSPGSVSTTPKPFVFVLMPFDPKFNDIYRFGIKGAADDAGAYAERVDEQIFQEGILARVFNQISKADIIIADMTERNPNVFYEVGYAHALGKIVLLLTQSANDIPFDLKHHQHIVYGDIQMLREKLAKQLKWAIAEARHQREAGVDEHLRLCLEGKEIPELLSLNELRPDELPLFEEKVINSNGGFYLSFAWRNISSEMSPTISYIYLFADSRALWLEMSVIPTSNPALPYQYRVPDHIPSMPPDAVVDTTLRFVLPQDSDAAECAFVFRIHGAVRVHEYGFRIRAERLETVK